MFFPGIEKKILREDWTFGMHFYRSIPILNISRPAFIVLFTAEPNERLLGNNTSFYSGNGFVDVTSNVLAMMEFYETLSQSKPSKFWRSLLSAIDSTRLNWIDLLMTIERGMENDHFGLAIHGEEGGYHVKLLFPENSEIDYKESLGADLFMVFEHVIEKVRDHTSE